MLRPTALALAAMLSTGAAAQAGNITVVDGDTVEVDGVSWRLLGYDTPETYFAKCDAEYDAGILAKQELEAMIRHAKTIKLENSGRRGRYRRVLGRLYLDGRGRWASSSSGASPGPTAVAASARAGAHSNPPQLRCNEASSGTT